MTGESPPIVAKQQTFVPKSPPLQRAPSRTISFSSRLLHLLHRAFTCTTCPPKPSQLCFEHSAHAAEHNLKILRQHDMDLTKVVMSERGSVTDPSYEFRSRDHLSPLFELSSDADKLKSICFSGVEYPFVPDADFTEEQRHKDIHFRLQKGHNRSAMGQDNFILSTLQKEMSKGWQFIIPTDACKDVAHLNLIPITIANKFTHMEDNRKTKVFKRRLAHDCSKPAENGESVNQLIDDDILEECRFGFVLLQVIHEIHMLRCFHPLIPILLCKYDLDAAFRRLSVLTRHAVMCALSFGAFVYICFRLPFGAKPAPALFSLLSEFIAELAQCLMSDNEWDPNTFHSPMLDEFDTTPKFDPTNLLPVNPLLFPYTPQEQSVRVYIDDLITISLALPHLVTRAIHAVPLILDTIFRPNTAKELHSRNPILSKIKTIAEGILSDQQNILGWIINTKNMKLFIPTQKALRIKAELKELLNIAIAHKPVPLKQLESVIGMLTHISTICHEGKFFLNRFRYRLKVAPRYKGFQFFDNMETEDLVFWISIVNDLMEGNVGRSTNAILHTIPTILTISDASEHGVGGAIIYNDTAFLWRFQIPDIWIGILSINLLEFIASAWTIIHATQFTSNQKILAVSDSTSAVSWLISNKHEPHKQPNHDKIARLLGRALFNTNNSLDQGHIKGERNVITDSLSRDTHIPFHKLVALLQQHPETKDQLPKTCHIFGENEDTLYSLLHSLVQNAPETAINVSAPKRSGLFPGAVGSNSAERSNKRTHFFETSRLQEIFQNEATSLHSQNCTDTITLAQKMGFELNRVPLEILSQKLQQHSRITMNQTQ